MRTKTAVLTAAALAAGALSSMAQNVYSLNVVGYINLTMAPGYNLIANQLVGADTTLNTVFGTGYSQDGYQVITWNSTTQGFNQPDTFYTAGTAGTAGWYDSSFATSTTSVAPGKGVFFYNPTSSSTPVTLVGQVTQGTNSISLGAGYSFVSTIPPISVDLGVAGPMALPTGTADGNQYFTFGGGSYSQPITYYTAATAGTAGWYDSSFASAPVSPAVGQGFVYLNTGSSSLTWVNAFSVQ